MTEVQEAVQRLFEQVDKEQEESHARTMAKHEEIMADIERASNHGKKEEYPCDPARSGTQLNNQPNYTEPREKLQTEDKQKICNLLLPALQATHNLQDLVSLEYREDRELVYATFASGHTKVVNVALDSGTSMIRDIVGQIV